MPPEPAGVLVILTLAACVVLCGCGGPSSSGTRGPLPGTPLAAPQAPEAPAVFITSPPFDGGVISGNVTIVVQVTHFSLATEGSVNVPGTGHLVYYLDAAPPVARGQPAFTQPGTYAVSPSPLYTWTDVRPGTHTFAVQLVNPDNTPLNPPVIDAVDVTVVSPEEIPVP